MNKIVVTGATGNVGRPLVQALSTAGAGVTAVARGITAGEVPDGVRWQRGDLAVPESLPLVGATALFVLTSADFMATGDLRVTLAAAADAGVQRVVLLSSQGVGTGRHPATHEQALSKSGLEWTVLRAGGFASNAFGWAPSVRAGRTVAAPFGNVALPVLDPTDIAAVAAAVLRSAGHAGRTYELTGPEAITPREQAEAIGRALAEPVMFFELTRAQARAHLLAVMPEPVADSTLDILGSPTPHEQAVSPDVATILGRPARTFADWAAANVLAFR